MCHIIWAQVCFFFSLFIWLLLLIYNTVIFIGINKAYQWPMIANKGQCKPLQANADQQKPTSASTGWHQANAGQQRSTTANDSQQRSTQATAGQWRPTKTHISQCMVTSGQHRPMKTNESPQLPAANASQWRPQNPTTVSRDRPRYVLIPFYSFILLLICYILVLIWPTQANEDQCRPTKTTEGQHRPTKTNESP